MRRATEIRGHHQCNGRDAAGASELVSARILATQRWCTRAVFRQSAALLRVSHFGHETTRGDSDITGATPQPRSVQVGQFMREFCWLTVICGA
jgi:hypothetical protein